MNTKEAREYFDETKNEFAQWRITRSSANEKIPEALWSRAEELTKHYSRSFVAKELRLYHVDLRKRLGLEKRTYFKAPKKSLVLELPRMAKVIPVVKPSSSSSSSSSSVSSPRPASSESRLLFEVESSGMRIRFFQ